MQGAVLALVVLARMAVAWQTDGHQYELEDRLVFGQGGQQQQRKMQRRVVQNLGHAKTYGAFVGGLSSKVFDMTCC